METLLTLNRRLGLGRLRAAAWLDDQTVLVATQAALWRWEPATGTLLFQTRLPFSVGALAFAPDGRQIVAVLKFGGGSISDKLRFLALVDAHTGELLHQPETFGPTYYSEDMHAVAYSPDGRFCAIISLLPEACSSRLEMVLQSA